MKKYIVEFTGTFFLVLAVGGAAVLGHAGPLAGIAIALTLAMMIYAGGHISGAHYNPAVTLAVFLRGKCEASDIPGYIASQLAGAAAAGAVTAFVLNTGGAIEAHTFAEGSTVAVLASEFLFTFALAFTVLNVATAKGTEGNDFYGVAIAFAVVGGAYTVGAISLGSFNPAVTTGLIVMGKLGAGDSWMHFVAELAAGATAAFAFKAVVDDSNEA